MNMVKSRLMSRNTLSSTIIGVIPQESSDDQVCCRKKIAAICSVIIIVKFLKGQDIIMIPRN